MQEMMSSAGKPGYMDALVLLLRLRQTCNHPDLIRKNLKKEKDAMISTSQQSKSSSQNESYRDDVDDVADMLGNLSVQSRKCDVCQRVLTKEEAGEGKIRCEGCESMIDKFDENEAKSDWKPQNQQRKPKFTKKIIDSDDEDEGEGDWIVPSRQRNFQHSEKAGGSDDENADGTGDWLGSEDSDTDGESHARSGTYTTKGYWTRPAGGMSDESAEEDENFDREGRRIMCSTKIRHLLKLLRDESSEHKFIVFSEFTSMLDLVEPFLKKESFKFTRYDGSMRNDEREASLQRLRDDKRTRILLCSLKCGSLGAQFDCREPSRSSRALLESIC